MMIKKLMVVTGLTVAVGAGSLVAPTPAKASAMTDYAVAQCGNGGWQQKQYPSYEDCYTAATQFYREQTGTGGGGGGGTWLPNLPNWSGNWGGCGATHLPCNPGH